MSDLCAHGQSLLIWIFFEDPQGELTRNAYDDDDDDIIIVSSQFSQWNLKFNSIWLVYACAFRKCKTKDLCSDNQSYI